jgi:hypothetical protein
LLHHGNVLRDGLEAFANLALPQAEVKRDHSGLFVSTRLDVEGDPVHAVIAELIEAGYFRWSSGSAPQFVR